MPDSRRPVPPLWLEREQLGVLRDDERAQLEKCCSEQERAQFAAEHEALARELLARLPPASFAQQIQARQQRQVMSQRPPRALPILAFVAALAVLALVSKSALERSDTGSGSASIALPGERAKGLLPSLRVYRKRSEGPELLAYGAQVFAGDVLQLGYLAPGMTHAVLLSIDGRGQVTLHFPHEGESSRIPSPQGERLLPASYELDDAPAFERFVLLTATRPLSPGEARRAARQLLQRGPDARELPLALPADVKQSSVLLHKADL